MKLTIDIDSNNDALTEFGSEYEIARLLRETADNIIDGHTSDALRDYNGHQVGTWTLTKTS